MIANVSQMLEVADDVKGLAADPKALDRAYTRLRSMGYSAEEADKATQRAERQMSQGMDKVPGMIVQSVIYNLLEKNYLSGFSDLFEAIYARDPGQALTRYAQNFGTGMVPLDGYFRFVERMVDPEIRDASAFHEGLMAMIPGLSNDLPALPDLWGKTRVSSVAYSPFGLQSGEASPTDAELERLGFFPDMPDKTINGVKLTSTEYGEFVRLAGNELKHNGLGAKEMIDAVVSGKHPYAPAYAKQSDGPEGGKAAKINDIVLTYRAAARKEMMQRHPNLRVMAEEGARAKAGAKSSIADPPTLN
jgi:hypothetical protein